MTNMKHLKLFLMALAMMIALNAEAYIQISPANYQNFIQNYEYNFPGRTVEYRENMQGSYDADLGAYIALLNPLYLPSFDTGYYDEYEGVYYGTTYGVAFITYKPLDGYYYYEDYGCTWFCTGNSISDYEYTNGIYQILYDEPYDPEDEFSNHISGPYFSGEFMSSEEVYIIIYTTN